MVVGELEVIGVFFFETLLNLENVKLCKGWSDL